MHRQLSTRTAAVAIAALTPAHGLISSSTSGTRDTSSGSSRWWPSMRREPRSCPLYRLMARHAATARDTDSCARSTPLRSSSTTHDSIGHSSMAPPLRRQTKNFRRSLGHVPRAALRLPRGAAAAVPGLRLERSDNPASPQRLGVVKAPGVESPAALSCWQRGRVWRMLVAHRA
jgi:hypothetical protein